MFAWPENYEQAWTLSKGVVRRGVGLHSGLESEIRLLPWEIPGLHFSFYDSKFAPVKLNPNQIIHSQLCTTLDLGGQKLSTVEHLLAALVGCGLTHVHIEVKGQEIPLLDGSAIGWVKAIEEAGIVPASSSCLAQKNLKQPIVIHNGESVITATPAEKLQVIGVIDFPYKAIGQQVFAIEVNPQNFVKEIAPARTFGFIDQVKKLQDLGFIKGGLLENALVCDGDSWLNPPLRFQNEPVRHKILDLIGDLAFVGLPKAQILVYRGSHALHAELASELFESCP